MHAATLRNLSAVRLSLPTKFFPFCHPLIQPVNDYQGHAQAQEMRRHSASAWSDPCNSNARRGFKLFACSPWESTKWLRG
eukprot:3711630-Pyramimonas_sp.AAC.1